MNDLRIMVLILLLLTLPHTLFGSDHAGPMKLRKAKTSMAEPFAFPMANQLIAALRPGLPRQHRTLSQLKVLQRGEQPL